MGTQASRCFEAVFRERSTSRSVACKPVSVWARDQGIIPDDVNWSDPFARMRLRQDEPEREPFTIAELKSVFGSPVFAEAKRPIGGHGEAAIGSRCLRCSLGLAEVSLRG